MLGLLFEDDEEDNFEDELPKEDEADIDEVEFDESEHLLLLLLTELALMLPSSDTFGSSGRSPSICMF